MALTDIYGQTIAKTGNTYTRGGVKVVATSDAKAVEAFNGMAPEGWTPPPAPPVTTIAAGDFVERFTPAEIAALIQWNPAVVMRVAASGTIDTTSKKLQAGFAAAVAAGKLTKARSDQILDLTQASP